MKKSSEDENLLNKDFSEINNLQNGEIKTTNVNILLNRVRLDKKKIFRKKLLIFSLLVLLLSFIVEFLSASAPAMLSAVLRQMSIGLHLKNFVAGIIDTRDIIFFLSLIFVCLFLSLRSLESHRWRG